MRNGDDNLSPQETNFFFFFFARFGQCRSVELKLPVSFVSTIPPPGILSEVTKTRIQNSISSWEKHASHKEQIIIFSDDQPSCDWLLSFSSVACVVHDCMHETLRIPTMDCIFNTLTTHAMTDVLCWLNADIILPSLFLKSIEGIFYQVHSEVMMVGQRKDIAIDRALTFDDGREQALGDTIEQGSLHMEYGLDFFVFRKSLLHKIPMLQFIVGAWRWDNY